MRPNPEGSAFFLDVDGTACHAVLHEGREHQRDTAVLMVAPFGWEDVSSYRARRVWATSLAEDGFPTLRFDLPGTGDSAGTPEDPALVDSWLRAIRVAAGELRSLTGCTKVAAIGSGLGGLLACAAASDGDTFDELVLWATPSRGRAVIRELKAFARLLLSTADDAPALPEGAISINGYLLSAETVAAVTDLEVQTNARPKVRRALLLGRDELPVDLVLPAVLREEGARITEGHGPGYGVFVSAPHHSVPPVEVIATVHAWLVEGASTAAPPSSRELPAEAIISSRDGTTIRERLVSLSTSAGELRGVLSEPLGPNRHLCAVLLNAGSIRRTGPSQMWVETARRWAANGVPTLRLDLAGLGDSDGEIAFPLEVLRLYEAEFGDQVSSALDALTALGVPDRFLLMGLCSGAYWSFQAGQHDPRVEAVIMLNPRALVIDPFVETLRAAGNFRGLAQPSAWLRLVSGRTPVAHITAVPRAAARAVWHAPAHWKARRKAKAEVGGDELDLGLHRMQANGTQAVLVFSACESLRIELADANRLDNLRTWSNLELHLLDGSVETHTLEPPHVRQEIAAIIDRALEDFLSSRGSGAHST